MINKKGFVLVETLVVAVFSSIIFAFLYASIVPLNGIYEERTLQEDNIDVFYDAYNIRNMLYNDVSFRKQLADDAHVDNYYLSYTYITCNPMPGIGTIGDETIRNIFSSVGNSNYCNSLMEKLGLRRKIGSNYKDYYRILYIKGISRESFLDNGVSLYRSYNKMTTNTTVRPVETYNVDIEDTIVKAVKAYTVDEYEKKAYLVVYDIYNDSVAVIDMVRHEMLDDCFTYQFIPNYENFYRTTAAPATNDYNYFIYNADAKRYESYLINGASSNCTDYFTNKGNSNPSQYCRNRFGNEYKDANEMRNFVTARFASRANPLYDSSDIAIVGYDNSCTKDVVIPDMAFGKNVTVIGYEAFKGAGLNSFTLGANVKIIDTGALEGNSLTNAAALRTTINNKGIMNLSTIS